MGLAERRAVEEFKTTQLPALTAEIGAQAGIAVPIEIEWNELTTDFPPHLFEKSWTQVFFLPVIETFKHIGRDAMGKTALAESLKKIVFRNSQQRSSPGTACSFASGVLTIDHGFCNAGDVAGRTKYLVTLIEKTL